MQIVKVSIKCTFLNKVPSKYLLLFKVMKNTFWTNMDFWKKTNECKVPNLLIKKQIEEEPKTLLKNQKGRSNDRALYFSV